MNHLSVTALACLATLAGMPAASPAVAATNLSGSYTLTLVNTRPATLNGNTLCVTLTENGSVMGERNSGVFAIGDANGSFFTKNHAISAEVPLGSYDFIVFSGVLGQPTIQGSSFLLVNGGSLVATGNFTATRSNCGTATR